MGKCGFQNSCHICPSQVASWSLQPPTHPTAFFLGKTRLCPVTYAPDSRGAVCSRLAPKSAGTRAAAVPGFSLGDTNVANGRPPPTLPPALTSIPAPLPATLARRAGDALCPRGPSLARPPPSLPWTLYPSHLGHCRPPSLGARQREGTGGGAAGTYAPWPPAGRGGRAWRQRVRLGPRGDCSLSSPPRVSRVPAHTRRWPGARRQCRG